MRLSTNCPLFYVPGFGITYVVAEKFFMKHPSCDWDGLFLGLRCDRVPAAISATTRRCVLRCWLGRYGAARTLPESPISQSFKLIFLEKCYANFYQNDKCKNSSMIAMMWTFESRTEYFFDAILFGSYILSKSTHQTRWILCWFARYRRKWKNRPWKRFMPRLEILKLDPYFTDQKPEC